MYSYEEVLKNLDFILQAKGYASNFMKDKLIWLYKEDSRNNLSSYYVYINGRLKTI